MNKFINNTNFIKLFRDQYIRNERYLLSEFIIGNIIKSYYNKA